MNELLMALYDSFYTPLEFEEQKHIVDTCHKELIKRLEKPERRLVLQIIDTQGEIAEKLSLDSFLCGFKLAWQLTNELSHVSDGRSFRPTPAGESARLFVEQDLS